MENVRKRPFRKKTGRHLRRHQGLPFQHYGTTQKNPQIAVRTNNNRTHPPDQIPEKGVSVFTRLLLSFFVPLRSVGYLSMTTGAGKRKSSLRAGLPAGSVAKIGATM